MSALGWSALTVGVFFLARAIFVRVRSPVLHPVLWATILMVVVLECSGRPYAAFGRSTQGLVWLLGPGVVALAVPIHRLRGLILAHAGVLVTVVLSSLLFSLASTGGVLLLFGAGRAVVEALCLKSVTAAVAFPIAREARALPMLAGVATMVAALMGATIGPWFLRLARVRDARAAGLALGCGSHVLGTVRAFEIDEETGTFASVGMALTALGAALICPALFLLFS